MRWLVILTAFILFSSNAVSALAEPADPTPQQIYERLMSSSIRPPIVRTRRFRFF
jgi:hypothetical protein